MFPSLGEDYATCYWRCSQHFNNIWMLFPLGAKFPPLTEPPKQLDEFDPFTVSSFGKA